MSLRVAMTLPIVRLVFALWVLVSFSQAAHAQADAGDDCTAQNLLAGALASEHENATGDLALVTNSQVGSEGTAWDAPVAVTFMGHGSLTYDLGRPRTIAALYLQADANDVYRVTGSLDGKPGSFQPIVDLPSAFSLGHGLRARTATFNPVSIRYLRVSGGTGDVSGRVEATNNSNDLRTERLIGHLSGLPHARPESVLVVGLGGGVSAGALTLYPELERLVICEIEPRVVGAARLFERENYGVLDDPRVEVVFDDARHFLATTREKFDVITSDPIHPWVRGNSMLFSREYYEIVKARLKPGGLATQWVPLYETNELAIKIQMRTFMTAFPHGSVWNTAVTGRGYDVVLVGGEKPLHLDVGALQRRIENNPRLSASLREVRINGALDLLATYGASGADMRAWLEDAPVNRDFSLKLEYMSGLALNAGEADPIYANMVARRTFPVITASAEQEAELRRRLGAR